MTRLQRMLTAAEPDLGAASAYLDGLTHEARVREIRSLGAAAQATLFDAAYDHRPIDLDFLVPAGHPPLAEVVHHGKNSLPALTDFAKVMCRPDDGGAGEIWGYNRSGALVERLVGPGYFVAVPHARGALLIDYLRVPPRKPAAWPRIIPNETRLSRFVYGGTQDVLRGVSAHVSIGRATRDGRPMDAWFVLCREDPR